MKPFVSVIIPVYRDWPSLLECLRALSAQTYAQGEIEVIVVNNTPEEPCPFELPAANMKLIAERKKSAYAARNAGVRAAKGSILAFTDADCQPDPGWVENGVRCLLEQGVSLVGGMVDFAFHNAGSAAEMLDVATHMDNQRSIQRYKAAVTANLFVKRSVFNTVGLFNENLQSGGDISLTQKAFAQGFEIAYCPKARVTHPTRGLKEGWQKLNRVASGQKLLLKQMPGSWVRKTKVLALHLIPLANPFRVLSTMRHYGNNSAWMFVRVMLLSVLMGLVYDVFLLKSLLFSERH